MTQPTPAVVKLDQAVIKAGLDLIRAELTTPRDDTAIAQLHDAYQAALAARWPHG